ncbi:hypothetical protein BJY01DRAFT_236482 [Aspergillus pseudoustus]|uniref:Uncharacterized protein n=1 Tax=Aspergillus pseudoustus TaxID=1810923 RepID=A0ABR4JNC5_9EURO
MSVARDAIDDLSGIHDPAIRRRVQNRLNQRAHHLTDPGARRQGKQRSTGQDSLQVARTSAFQTHNLTCTFLPPAIHDLMHDFEKQALASYITGSPQTDHLLSLSRVNLLRAAYENVVAVGMAADWLCCDEAISAFSPLSPTLAPAASTSATTTESPGYFSIPPSLAPTALQRTVPHHPWADIFPFPAMRDNLIRAVAGFEDDEFCHDITGFWDTRRSNATLLVWGTPWDARNWEATEEFVRKWGALLMVGCPELLVSTNAWRRARGEKPLRWRGVVDDGNSSSSRVSMVG